MKNKKIKDILLFMSSVIAILSVFLLIIGNTGYAIHAILVAIYMEVGNDSL